MSKTKKILIAVFSILLIGALAFLITWGVINFNKVKEGMSGTGLYTKTDLDNAYNDGYNTALEDKDEYENLINGYKDTITMQTDALAKLNSEKENLTISNEGYVQQVNKLTGQKNTLDAQVLSLRSTVSANETTIADLNKQITELEGQITKLENNVESGNTTVEELRLQVSALQEQRRQLQTNNEEHLLSIANLNSQIADLNSHIDTLNLQIQNNNSATAQLNDRIAELQKTVSFYENYLAEHGSSDLALVTFEFAGSVYNVQSVNKGGKALVADPVSTEYLIFNGWTVDNERIDLSTYVVQENVRIVADVTYKYVVNFAVDGEVKFTQTVLKGEYAQEPTKPRKNGYTFKYWTLDGETEIHFEQYPIVANTTFNAKFVQLFTVEFVNNGEVVASRRVEYNKTTSTLSMESTDRKVFNGWTVNGIVVDVSNYAILEDTRFVAKFTDYYETVFVVDSDTWYTQLVESGKTVNNVPTPNKEHFTFDGWQVNGETVDLNSYTVTQDTTFTASFTETAKFKVEFVDGLKTILVQYVYEGDYATEPGVVIPVGKSLWWTVDGKTVNILTYEITADTKFVANWGTLV